MKVLLFLCFVAISTAFPPFFVIGTLTYFYMTENSPERNYRKKAEELKQEKLIEEYLNSLIDKRLKNEKKY